MSSLVEAFDLLVVGDEPAAHWWMEKCLAYTKAHPRDGKKTYSIPKIAHLSLRSDREILLPSSIAQRFGMRADHPHEVECIFPERLLTWNKATLIEHFHFKKTLLLESPWQSHPKNPDLAMLRYHIAESPELLEMAQGLWRLFGRSEALLPESLLWNALQLGSYSFWSPLPLTQVRQTQSSELPPANWLRIDSHGNFELEMLSGATFSAPQLLLAVNGNELAGLRTKCPDLAGFLPGPAEFLSQKAVYTLPLGGVDTRLLQQLKACSVLFEDSSLPMPEEIHVVKVQAEKQNLSIDFLSKSDFSLDEISHNAASAYRQLVKLIPDLKKTPHTIGLPLNADDCDSEDERLRAIRTFQAHRAPRYSATRTHRRTLHPRVSLFTPFLNCHLAYPFGQLEAAQNHLEEYLGSRRYRKSTHAVEGAAFFS